MSTTVLEMIEKAGIDLAQAETIFVWIDDKAGVVSLEDAPRWLDRMGVFDDDRDPAWDGYSTLPRNAIYGAQIWLPGQIVRTIEVDGLYRLQWISTTPAGLMRMISRQQLMPVLDIGTGLTWNSGRAGMTEPTILLREATALLVREMMTLPDDAVDFDNHGWHCVGVADGVERLFDRLGYWTVAANQARMDVKSARLRTIKSVVDAARAGEPSREGWTPEDDRFVLIGQIAEQIEGMPIKKLERILTLAQHIREE